MANTDKICFDRILPHEIARPAPGLRGPGSRPLSAGIEDLEYAVRAPVSSLPVFESHHERTILRPTTRSARLPPAPKGTVGPTALGSVVVRA